MTTPTQTVGTRTSCVTEGENVDEHARVYPQQKSVARGPRLAKWRDRGLSEGRNQMRAVLAAALIAAIVGLGASGARADTITEVFSFSAINGLDAGDSTSESGSAVDQFNPALGTLNSVDVAITVTATWPSGTLAPDIEATLGVDSFSFEQGGAGMCTSPCPPLTIPVGDTVPTGDLSDFIGTGTISTSIMIRNDADVALNATFSDESVTYSYTPVAVPEPGGLPVLLTVGGLLFGAKLLERGKRRRLQFG